MQIIPTPPHAPSRAWEEAFVAETIRQLPGFSRENAHHCANLAHPWVWLLDGEEAAELWSLAIGVACAQKSGVRRS